MKLAKLSLAAIVVAGLTTSSFAADTLADAFKNGKVSGQLKSSYFSKDNGTTTEGIINTGITLGYVTDAFMGFKMGATLQSSHAPFADGAIGTANTEKDMFKGDLYGSGAVLSEAYLEYNVGNTMARVGRQFVAKTPLVTSSGSRFIRTAIEGAVIINKDLPDTTLWAAYVDKYQNRTDDAGNIAKFLGNYSESKNLGENGAYSMMVLNKSIPGVTLTAQYGDMVDHFNIYYLEAAYAGKASNFTYGLAAQYSGTNYDPLSSKNTGISNDTSYYGVKASLGVGDFNGYIAYSKVDDDGDAQDSIIATDPIFTANEISSNTYKATEKAYAIDANYKINANAKLGARYTSYSYDTIEVDVDIMCYYGEYNFDGALKGFGLEAYFETLDKATGADTKELRFKAIYKF